MKRVNISFFEAEDRNLIKDLRKRLNETSKRCCWLKKKKPMTEELKKKIAEYEDAEMDLVNKLIALGDF